MFRIALACFISLLPAGLQGDVRADEYKRVSFKLDRNRVIVPTVVNGSHPLNLILDTGMTFDGVYLFRGEFAEKMDTTGAIEVRVPGAGSGEASTAIMMVNGILEFGDIRVDSQRVIISMSSHTQSFRADGVFGWNLFGHYIVEIDYDKQMILLWENDQFDPDSSWNTIPITLTNNIPFLDGELESVEGESTYVRLYIDLASGDAVELLTGADQKFAMPDSLTEEYLGTGLSGDIFGHRGRIKRLSIGGFHLLDIPTSFAPAEVRSKQEGADGILGNDYISRFNIIFDYGSSRIYLKPNRYFDDKFE